MKTPEDWRIPRRFAKFDNKCGLWMRNHGIEVRDSLPRLLQVWKFILIPAAHGEECRGHFNRYFAAFEIVAKRLREFAGLFGPEN